MHAWEMFYDQRRIKPKEGQVMRNFIGRFIRNEAGAVTVDWVLLTAALILLGFLIMSIVGVQAQITAGHLKDTMINMIPPE